jgi:hypothetical protein
MKLFAEDPEMRRLAGTAAREFLIANEYTREGQARRFAALYQEIQPG